MIQRIRQIIRQVASLATLHTATVRLSCGCAHTAFRITVGKHIHYFYFDSFCRACRIERSASMRERRIV